MNIAYGHHKCGQILSNQLLSHIIHAEKVRIKERLTLIMICLFTLQIQDGATEQNMFSDLQ